MDKDRIAGSAKDFAGKIEGAVGDVTGDAKTQASGRTREAAGSAQDLYGQAKDAARSAVDSATGYTQDALGGASSEALAKKVQENPLGSLLVAGSIGFVLALLMRRPLRRPAPRWRD
jgi:uncharacterized protein YjbJ (UPF0337 family)